jgi:hypothetical protein
MATTTNFGWETPDDTDLVKDGALAMRTLGNAIDTSLVDLKGGTTGQVLSKTSNTDMDFTWVTSDDANAIQNTIVDAKGDLITATGSDVPARLAVGNNGDTLLADSSATTGLRWQGNYAAGKNAVINGAFDIWQRGTSITGTGNGTNYTADRWATNSDGTGFCVVSRETFTPGTAPVSGYEGTYFLRQTINTAGTATYHQLLHRIEDVRKFAGQTVTLSFWAKAESARSGSVFLQQNFGSGGSGTVTVINNSASAFTTSWQRFTYTVAMPSISGKTVGNSSYIQIIIRNGSTTATNYIDVWGVQLEAADTATAFQTATGTLQGEIALAQRYYYRWVTGGTSTAWIQNVFNYSTTIALGTIKLPVTMRVNPTSIDVTATAADYRLLTGSTVSTCSAVPVLDTSNADSPVIKYTVASGLTLGQGGIAGANSTNNAYIGFNAEL